MHRTCRKIVSTVVIVVALVLAIVVSVLPQQSLSYIIFVSRFFDVMLPILAVGALLKYLVYSDCHHEDDSCNKK
jgi:hypothetical protein